MNLISKYGVPEKIKKHCKKVAFVAEDLAVKLNQKGCNLNVELIRFAALLHDIARTEKNHAVIGGEWLNKSGYPEVAEIVASHMKLEEYDANHITEKTVVFLADKLVKEDELVSLEQRYKSSIECADKSEIQEKYKQAVLVNSMVFNVLKMR